MNLRIKKSEAEKMLCKQIEKAKKIIQRFEGCNEEKEFDNIKGIYSSWENYTIEVLLKIFPTEKQKEEFRKSSRAWCSGVTNSFLHEKVNEKIEDVRKDIVKLQGLIERLELFDDFKQAENVPTGENGLERIVRLLRRFHHVAKQLSERHEDRQTLEINDEYDVQDLLHALLKIEIDDIRQEEPTPSCAAKASRMDFLLKDEKIAIETKKTRKSLGLKELSDQIIVDIARYREHKDCEFLIFFIYDPEQRIRNSVGLKKDLEKQSPYELKVIIEIIPS